MSGRQSKKREWRVRQMFEPDRLSVERLSDAYESLMSKRYRVIKAETEPTTAQNPTTYQHQKGA